MSIEAMQLRTNDRAVSASRPAQPHAPTGAVVAGRQSGSAGQPQDQVKLSAEARQLAAAPDEVELQLSPDRLREMLAVAKAAASSEQSPE